MTAKIYFNELFRRINVVIMIIILASALCLIGAKDNSSLEQAEQILAESGVKGGLVVHIGCGDGSLTAALRANDSYMVHGIDTDKDNIKKARGNIRSLGIYGKVSVDIFNGNNLPYTDNLVNLVVSENPGGVSMDEVMRVLCPNGVAYIKKDGQWTRTVKPRPEEIDDWTHYLHDASGNPVAHDSVVDLPRHLQWVGSPKWSRHHDTMASMSALVSANGRAFYIFDEGPTASIQLPPKWSLVARDAFNGVVLWRKPISLWNTHLWPLKSGPAHLPRRLIAIGDTVYVTLGLDAPLTALDGATGEVIRTYDETKGTVEVIGCKANDSSDIVLFSLVSDTPAKDNEFRPEHTYVWDNTNQANREWAWENQKRQIVASEADTGKALWKKEYPVAPLTLAADKKFVFFHDGEKVVCLNRENGDEIWVSESVERRSPINTSFGPRLVVYEDVVVFAGGKLHMTAFSAETGKQLWTAEHARSGHQSPEDIIIIDGVVWSGAIANTRDSGIFTGLDLHTGEIKSQFPPDVETYWFHHRCYPSKATDRYILSSRTGVEFVDFQNNHWTTNHWVRGGCIYGVMPCNGMVYAPPHACACYMDAKLNGLNALAPGAIKGVENASDDDRLEKGPAYGKEMESPSTSQDDWPTYRHDPERSGSIKSSVSTDLKLAWKSDKLGENLSSMAFSDGKAFVADKETHTLYALKADSGKILWQYTAGGPIDSAPTIYQGRVLFGSADGRVYCLRASDGELIWRFRAAPVDQRMMAFEQLESVWPVHGSVLIHDDVLYFTAGRSMFLDGGLRLLRLDPETGEKLSEAILDDKDPESSKNLQIYVKGLNMPAALSDVLSCDGKYVYMRTQRFDLQGNRQQIAPQNVAQQEGEGCHLFAPIGLLDDTIFYRSYWMYGKNIASGWGGWFQAGRFVPSGQPLVFDESFVYGFGRKPEHLCQSPILEYHVFAGSKDIKDESIKRIQSVANQMNKGSTKNNASAADWKLRQGYFMKDLSATDYKWSESNPSLQARAMVLADKMLFMAGPPDLVDEEEAFWSPDDPKILAKLKDQADALEGQKGSLLWAVSAEDGKKISEYNLDSTPVFDGMMAANGKLYMAMKDGRVLCFMSK